MGLGLELRDERCNVIRRLEDNQELARLVPGLFDDGAFPYLRLIDLYGDTVFSEYQLRMAVLSEIEALAVRAPGVATQGLVEMARECVSSVHTYLVFVGD